MNRNDFPMLKDDLIYFDNGATTFKPQVVIDSIVDYYSNYCSNAHRGDYDISLKVDKEYEEVRDLVKDFIHADRREEIIFTSGSTDSINMIVNGFFKNNLEPEDEIILSVGDHASNLLPWFNLSNELSLNINFIPLDESYYVILDNLKKIITPHTKVVALASITNVIGDLRPIKEITEYCHKQGIYVVCDASQSIGHIETNVTDLDVDFLAFSAHKMYGPTGVGVLYGKYELLDNLYPTRLGGGMNENFDNIKDFTLKNLPTRLEAGTPNIAGVIGLGKAVTYLTKLGLTNIHLHEMKLREYLINSLIKIPHIDIINMEADSGIVTFNVDGIFCQDVSVYLNKYHICVRTGNHCTKLLKNATNVKNTIRVSFGLYNTFEEIDTLVELLEDKDKIIKEML